MSSVLRSLQERGGMNKCEGCDEDSEDVEYRMCPYQYDINDKEVWEYLCDYCYNQRFMDR